MEDDEFHIPTCCICLGDLTKDLAAFPCGHVLHYDCATDLLFKHSIKQCPQCKQRAYSLVKLYWETESPPPPQLDAELPGDTIELQQIIKKNAAFVERLKSQISDLESTSAELEKRLSVANSEVEQCRVKLFEERKRGKRYKLGLEDLERQNTRLSLQLDKVTKQFAELKRSTAAHHYANTGDLAALKDAFSGKDSKSLKKIVLSQQQAIETRMKWYEELKRTKDELSAKLERFRDKNDLLARKLASLTKFESRRETALLQLRKENTSLRAFLQRVGYDVTDALGSQSLDPGARDLDAAEVGDIAAVKRMATFKRSNADFDARSFFDDDDDDSTLLRASRKSTTGPTKQRKFAKTARQEKKHTVEYAQSISSATPTESLTTSSESVAKRQRVLPQTPNDSPAPVEGRSPVASEAEYVPMEPVPASAAVNPFARQRLSSGTAAASAASLTPISLPVEKHPAENNGRSSAPSAFSGFLSAAEVKVQQDEINRSYAVEPRDDGDIIDLVGNTPSDPSSEEDEEGPSPPDLSYAPENPESWKLPGIGAIDFRSVASVARVTSAQGDSNGSRVKFGYDTTGTFRGILAENPVPVNTVGDPSHLKQSRIGWKSQGARGRDARKGIARRQQAISSFFGK